MKINDLVCLILFSSVFIMCPQLGFIMLPRSLNEKGFVPQKKQDILDKKWYNSEDFQLHKRKWSKTYLRIALYFNLIYLGLRFVKFNELCALMIALWSSVIIWGHFGNKEKKEEKKKREEFFHHAPF